MLMEHQTTKPERILILLQILKLMSVAKGEIVV